MIPLRYVYGVIKRKIMGRPAKPERERFNARLDRELIDYIDERAKKLGIAKNEALNQLLYKIKNLLETP